MDTFYIMTEEIREQLYFYNPSLPLVHQFDWLRDTIRPKAYTDKAIAEAMEELYDAVALVMQEYRDTLASDDPLALYLNYFVRNPKEKLNELEVISDEQEEPVLYATVPLNTPAIQTKVGVIKPLTTVRITSASQLGDVGITTNLSASRGFETRVFWDSLTDYRVTVEKVKNDASSAE